MKRSCRAPLWVFGTLLVESVWFNRPRRQARAFLWTIFWTLVLVGLVVAATRAAM